MPVVSVLMAFHRDTPFLRPAIASVLAQSLSDFEFVLVDDGTGLAPEALGELGRDPRLRWVRQPRQMGIVAAHNAGVAASRGEFIALLDHDDLMRPSRLERQVECLRAEPALGLVSSLAETIDAQGRVIGGEFALIEPDAQRCYTQYAAPVVTPAYTGRRDVFLALSFRPEFPFAADFDFLARAAERWSMAAVPEKLLQYRRHECQATQVHADPIEHSRCVIRLLTARRRAGRAEAPDDTWSGVVGKQTGAESCRRMAKQCLREGFSVLAAYHARRSFTLKRTAASGFVALRLAWLGWSRSRADERALAMRMFFSGPVRAHGLTPA